jgi:hypothetical protein
LRYGGKAVFSENISNNRSWVKRVGDIIRVYDNSILPGRVEEGPFKKTRGFPMNGLPNYNNPSFLH